MRKALFGTILLSVVIFLAGALPAAAAPRYTCKDLGTLPVPYNIGTTAYGLNNAGQVVGYGAVNGGSSYHAFLYTPGVGMQDLGTLPDPYNNRSFAYGINDAGQVVGYSGETPGYQQVFPRLSLQRRPPAGPGPPPRRL